MNAKADQVRRRLMPLQSWAQTAFLLGCVEHVLQHCEARDTEARPLLEVGWSFVRTGQRSDDTIRALRDQLDASINEDSDSDIVSVVSAAELIATTLDAPNERAHHVLYNLNDAVGVLDPNPNDGIQEEEDWRERFLDFIMSITSRETAKTALQQFLVEPMAWHKRN